MASGTFSRATGCGDGSFSALARYYNVGPRFYQVLAVFKTKGGGAAAAKRFVESFTLLPRMKPMLSQAATR